jgi:hypothetical protein
MSIDQDFAEFVGARWVSLYRLAYLLAASPTGAEACCRPPWRRHT